MPRIIERVMSHGRIVDELSAEGPSSQGITVSIKKTQDTEMQQPRQERKGKQRWIGGVSSEQRGVRSGKSKDQDQDQRSLSQSEASVARTLKNWVSHDPL